MRRMIWIAILLLATLLVGCPDGLPPLEPGPEGPPLSHDGAPADLGPPPEDGSTLDVPADAAPSIDAPVPADAQPSFASTVWPRTNKAHTDPTGIWC